MSDLLAAGLVSSGADWRVLPGGRTNLVWGVSDTDGDRVVKLYRSAADTPLFRNDPQAEVTVLDALKDSGLSPRPVFSGHLRSGVVLIYDHQAGLPWRFGLEGVATVLKALHALPLSASLSTLVRAPDGSLALVEQTLSMLEQIPPKQADPIRALQPQCHVGPTDLRRLLHGDPVPDNLICPVAPPGGLPVLIDWQCPALGDPVLDLALFLSPAMQHVCCGKVLSQEECQAFLRSYDDPEAVSRLAELQPHLHWRMAAYCLWKLTRPMPDPAYGPALEAELAALSRATS